MSDIGISAAKAYMQAAQTAARAVQGADDAGVTTGVDGVFGQMLDTAISKTTQAGQTAETAITSAAMGNADLVDVVTAVAAAEATLETVVAVRDEVIKAYQEIMRMPI